MDEENATYRWWCYTALREHRLEVRPEGHEVKNVEQNYVEGLNEARLNGDFKGGRAVRLVYSFSTQKLTQT